MAKNKSSAKEKVKELMDVYSLNLDYWKSDFNYEETKLHYYNTIYELYSTTFRWDGLPQYMYDEKADIYIEKRLTDRGRVLFFYDDILDKYLSYTYTGQNIGWYGYWEKYYVSNPIGYTRWLDKSNAVEIFNSPYFTAENIAIRKYADMLTICDMILLQNLNAQKIPYIITTTQNQETSIRNFLSKLDNWDPAIILSKDFELENIKILQTSPKYVGNDVITTKKAIWDEIFMYCGIGSNQGKMERVNVLESSLDSGPANASLLTRLTMREQAADEINRKFNLPVSVSVREDLKMRLDIIRNQNVVDEFYEDTEKENIREEGEK